MRITDEFDAALRDHAAMLDGIPADRFVPRLRKYTEHSQCGTLACSAGWARIKDGLRDDYSRIELHATGHGYWVDLFGVRGNSYFDDRLENLTISDKDLCLFRICSLLLRAGRQISPEYQRRMKEWTR